MMDEQIYKLTDKGLAKFQERIGGCCELPIRWAFDILLEVIDWDKNNVREIEERNNNAAE